MGHPYHLGGGRGNCQKVTSLYIIELKAYLVKWVMWGGRGQKYQKMGDVIYKRPHTHTTSQTIPKYDNW